MLILMVAFLCAIGIIVKNVVAYHVREKAAVEEAMAAQLPR